MVNIRSLFSLKYGALLMLVGQNTLLVLLMRISRTTTASGGSVGGQGEVYAASTAVVCMEILKLITCLSVVYWQQGASLCRCRCLSMSLYVSLREHISARFSFPYTH